jgi:hypothetical protein
VLVTTDPFRFVEFSWCTWRGCWVARFMLVYKSHLVCVRTIRAERTENEQQSRVIYTCAQIASSLRVSLI